MFWNLSWTILLRTYDLLLVFPNESDNKATIHLNFFWTLKILNALYYYYIKLEKKKSQFLALEIETLCINLIQLIEKAVSSRPTTHPQDFRQ